jgi:TRAP-type C4-dicarboxylate transport system permease small subunit
MELDYSKTGKLFPRADRVFRALEKAGLWVSSVALVLMGLLVVVSIGGRALIGKTIPDDNLLIGGLMVATVALSLAVVAATRGNIVVEVFTNKIGDRGHRLLNAFSSFIGLAMMIPLTWASWLALKYAVVRGTYFDGLLHVPQWPARVLFFSSFILISVRLLLMLVEDVAGAISSNRERPNVE